MRNGNLELCATFLGQQLLQDICILYLGVRQYPPWQVGIRHQVELLYELGDDMPVRVIPCAAHDVVVASDHVALPHEEHVHHAVILPLRYCHNIEVLAPNPNHFLILIDDLHCVESVSQRRRALELQLSSGICHVGLELAHDGIRIAFEERDHLLHHSTIFVAICESSAGCNAALDVVLQARPVIVAGNCLGASPVGE